MSDVRKRMKFPGVALSRMGHMPLPGDVEKKVARVFYVAATRVTQCLFLWVKGGGGFNHVFAS
jgi:hypothetical protein